MSGPTRVPPHDLNAERAVLGGILLENEALEHVLDVPVRPEDFYSDANGKIFETMVQLASAGQPVDTITLRERLVQTSRLSSVGGDEYLFSLTNTIPMVANIEAHARIVAEKADVRRMITTCHEVAALGYGDCGAANEYLDASSSKLTAAMQGRSTKETARSLDELADLVVAEVMIPPDPNAPPTLTTGLNTVDRALGGLEPGCLYVYAGRPGMGKSAAAVQALIANARKGQFGVIWSLEMKDQKLARRAIAGMSRVNSRHLKYGVIRPDEARRYLPFAKEFTQLPMRIENAASMPIDAIARSMKHYKRKHNLKLAVVDYLQIVRASGDHGNREQEVSEVSRTLKLLAMQLEIPIIAVSQLNRTVEARQDKRPLMSDLRESGAIEQDADGIIFFYREDYYAQGRRPDTNIAEWIIGKNREGETCFVKTHFAKEFTWFDDLAQEAA